MLLLLGFRGGFGFVWSNCLGGGLEALELVEGAVEGALDTGETPGGHDDLLDEGVLGPVLF